MLLVKLEYWVPLLHTVRNYRVEWLRNDFAAGVSVAAIQIPTAIAYAPLAGFRPEVGLYASILPLAGYALFGSSRQLIVGPDAATCAIVASVLVPLAAGDPEKYAVLSAILGLLVGGLCILGGIARLGFLADFLSRPVLTGLMNGIALSIIVGQLGKVLGFSAEAQYNRAGVERVMGFTSEAMCRRFLELTPLFEKFFIESGIILVKYWFEVGMEEQTRRFKQRIEDPRKPWKLSPMDLEAHRRWYDYSRARDDMFAATDSEHAPWYVVQSDNKRRARLNCISHLLSLIPYKDLPRKKVKLPPRQKSDGYQPLQHPYRYIPEQF